MRTNVKITPVVEWSLDEALVLIRDLSPKLKQVGFAVALTGSVLTAGKSSKDLDLARLSRSSHQQVANYTFDTRY
jgi:hypothetical protein